MIKNHPSGYTGAGYTDAKGDSYTDYGAYLRTDNFQYPQGAKISPNGMYFDTGGGWQYAGYASTYDPSTGQIGTTPSSMYGKAPGSDVWGSTGGAVPAYVPPPEAAPSEVGGVMPVDTSPTVEQIAIALRDQEIQRQIEEYYRRRQELEGY